MASGSIPKYADGNDSGWIDLTDSAITGKLVYRKIGNVFQIKSSGWNRLTGNNLASGSYRTIATIPNDGYRPSLLIGYIYINTSPIGIGVLKIENGVITIVNGSTVAMTGGGSSGTGFMINATGFFS